MFMFILHLLATFGVAATALMIYANWWSKRAERKTKRRANAAELFAFFKWPEPLGKPWPPFPGRPWTIVDLRPRRELSIQNRGDVAAHDRRDRVGV